MTDQEFSGRVVLVTGGSRGIGRAVSIGLGRSGAKVAVNYAQNEPAAKATLAEIEAIGGSGGIYPGDVSNESAVRSMTAEIERTLGPIDMLVTSAGIADAQDHQKLTFDNYQNIMATNVDGTFLPIMGVNICPADQISPDSTH